MPAGLRTPDPRIVRGHVALSFVQVMFGLLPVIGTMAFAAGAFTPLGVGAWRIGTGAAVLLGVAFAKYGRRALPRPADVGVFFVAAMLGVAVNQGLYLVGLSRSTPMNAGLVMSLIPVFTFVIAAAVRQERFNPLRALGVLVAFSGAVPLVFQDGLHTLGAYTAGNLLMVSNALCYSGYLVVSKTLTRRYPALVVTAWSYGFSLIAVPFFAFGQRLAPDPGMSQAWWSLAYVLVFPTILGYLLNIFALGRVRASTTAVYVYAQPLITALAAWLAFDEEPTPAMLVAAAALFVGIWLVGRRPPPMEAAEETGE